VDEAKSDRPEGISEDAQRWFDDQSAIERYCADRPDTFAGRWWENGGTSEVLAFTDDPGQHLTDLRSLLNDPSTVSVVRLPNTYRSLLKLRDAIPGILGTTEGLAEWGPDVKGNCVLVRALPGYLKDVRDTLTALYSDIRVEVGERPVPT
jgi:hypothetical protein